MRKLYSFLFLISCSLFGFAQVIITEMADPDNNSSARYVELFNVGSSSVDLTGWELRRWTNGNTATTSTIDLSSVGMLNPGAYVTVANNGAEFTSVYGFAPTIAANTGGPADSNGDDQIGLFNNMDTLVDIFGVPGEDGSDTCHEFEDGRAERIASVTAPNATWNEAEWNVWADDAVSGCTSHTNAVQMAPDDFDPGTWIGDTNACPVNIGMANYNCNTNTEGDNNDEVVIEIPYTGSDASITSLTTSTVGAMVGGDSPSTVADGQITISGLSEGDNWQITLNGGNCDGNTFSGTVPADVCDPADISCFNLSDGSNQFIIESVTVNTDMDEWTYDNTDGTYSMNGFCGSGCEEVSEGWLIFGSLDTTSATGLTLSFSAIEAFGTTDLNVMYTTNYTDASSSTWTNVQTITDAGNYEIDLSSINGTDVVFGIQYLDDGTDGFSSWTLTDVAFVTSSTGTCPTLDLLAVNEFRIDENNVKVFVSATNQLEVSGMQAETIEVYNSNGQRVALGNSNANVTKLTKGVYIALIMDENGNRVSKKFLKN